MSHPHAKTPAIVLVRRWLPRIAAVALLSGAAACGADGSNGDATPTAVPPVTTLERLTAAYADADTQAAGSQWQAMLDDELFETQAIAVAEFVRIKDDSSARDAYNAYADALSAAFAAAGGEMISVNDILMPGVGDLDGYDGGVSFVASLPSMKAYVDAMLDEDVLASAEGRRAAIEEAQILLGPNLVPETILQLPPNEPASAFPSDRVRGKSADAIVGELLEIYPSGGADPTADTLRAMVQYEGFDEQRVHFINLYRFKEDGGEASLGEYNAAALPSVLAHGGRPKVLANVTYHLAGPVAWDRFIFVSWPSLAVFTDLRLEPAYIEAQEDRVVSGEEYGNLITIARADRSSQ